MKESGREVKLSVKPFMDALLRKGDTDGRKNSGNKDRRAELLAMSRKEMLAEIVLELRQNSNAVENLRDEIGDLYTIVREMAWDRNVW